MAELPSACPRNGQALGGLMGALSSLGSALEGGMGGHHLLPGPFTPKPYKINVSCLAIPLPFPAGTLLPLASGKSCHLA